MNARSFVLHETIGLLELRQSSPATEDTENRGDSPAHSARLECRTQRSRGNGARGLGLQRRKPLNQLPRLRTNCAPVHVPLRRLRAASCGLASTANSSSQRLDSLQPSGNLANQAKNGDGGKVLEISVAADPTASRGAIWDLERSEILDLARAICEIDDLWVPGEER